jgi:probable phosphomutase (TIGR03848 family)
MTTFLLIRHGLCDSVGRAIAGRAPGVHLNHTGQAQAEALAHRLAGIPIAAVYSSPLERARETATPLAKRQGKSVAIVPELNELDFGDWTGRTLAELDQADGWREFNAFRSGTRIPGGELMSDVQSRAVGALERLARWHGDATVAAVSHGDVIRAMLTYFLGMPLDLLQRLEIAPASISVVRFDRYGPVVPLINSTEDWPPPITPR